MGSFNDDGICGRCHKPTDSFGHASPNICACRDSGSASQLLPTQLNPPKPPRITADEWLKQREAKLREIEAANEAAAIQCIDRFMLLIQDGKDPWQDKKYIDLDGEYPAAVAELVRKQLTEQLRFGSEVHLAHGESFPGRRVRVFKPLALG